MTGDTSLLTFLEDHLRSQVASAGDKFTSPEEKEAEFNRLFNAAEPELVESTLSICRSYATSMLPSNRARDREFEDRCLERWMAAFDHLEIMWHVAEELGEKNSEEVRRTFGFDAGSVRVALDNLFPKALLISREIICLLKGGYPDGALARWRSLHEVVVTSMYISKHGEEVALSYLASFHFAARRAMRQLVEHASKSGIEPPTLEELAEFDARCTDAETRLGRCVERDADGEWPKINPIKQHRNFYEIEKSVDLGHWRPRYKWASMYLHAGHRPNTHVLGMSESERDAHLTGQSNGGFVDPMQMTAISLGQATITYLLSEVNVDRLVYAKVMSQLVDEMLDLPMGGDRPQE